MRWDEYLHSGFMNSKEWHQSLAWGFWFAFRRRLVAGNV